MDNTSAVYQDENLAISSAVNADEIVAQSVKQQLPPDFALKAKKRKALVKTLFIISMMAYPLLHFIVMWGFVNVQSVLYTFQEYSGGVWKFATPIFSNYATVIDQFLHNADTRQMLLNSLLYVPVTCLITIPLSIVTSYFIFKKIVGAGVFRTIFFLPSIVPLVILTMIFQFGFQPSPIGIVTEILKWFGGSVPASLMGANTATSVYVFCIWAGVGYYIILLGGAMARIPKGIMEYSKLEGIGMCRELIQIVIPLCWPTIVTVLVLGMTSMFTVYLQPFFLTGFVTETKTLALVIFNEASVPAQYNYLATLGLFCSLIGAPLIMLARWGLNKCFAEVEF